MLLVKEEEEVEKERRRRRRGGGGGGAGVGWQLELEKSLSLPPVPPFKTAKTTAVIPVGRNRGFSSFSRRACLLGRTEHPSRHRPYQTAIISDAGGYVCGYRLIFVL